MADFFSVYPWILRKFLISYIVGKFSFFYIYAFHAFWSVPHVWASQLALEKKLEKMIYFFYFYYIYKFYL